MQTSLLKKVEDYLHTRNKQIADLSQEDLKKFVESAEVNKFSNLSPNFIPPEVKEDK